MPHATVQTPEVRPVPFGRYELLGRLGEGGMAEVFLARQRGPMGFEKLLVVKKIHAHLVRRKQFIDMFLDEARIAARIDNPRVVHIYELGQVDGHYYMAMEYLAGESLSIVLSEASRQVKQLPPRLAARIIAWVAEGLHAAHELKAPDGSYLEVVHRDVSPSNVIVLFNGGVKVVDFGVAKARGRVSESTGGELKGKFSYMSPEQIQDGTLDRRADVFSLGVVLWESLAMRRLFKTNNEASTIRSILKHMPAPPSVLRPEIDEGLDQIVLKALAKQPDERFQTCEEMRKALEGYLFQCGEQIDAADISSYMSNVFADRIDVRRRLMESLQRVSAPGLEEAQDLLPRVGPDEDSDSIRLPYAGDTPSAPAKGDGADAGIEAGLGELQDLISLERELSGRTVTRHSVQNAATRRATPGSLPRRRGWPWLAALAGGAALVAAGALWFFSTTGEGDGPGAATADTTSGTETADIGSTAAASTSDDGVNRLLDDAEQAIRTGRFTIPPGHNALELIVAAEELDPDHERIGEVRNMAVTALLDSADRLWRADRKPAARALYREVLWFDARNELALKRGEAPEPRPVVAAVTPTLGKDDVARLGWLVNQVELAVLDRRFIAPPGHNALEYLVELRKLDPTNTYVARLGERVAKLMDAEAKKAPAEAEALAAAAERLRSESGDAPADTTTDPTGGTATAATAAADAPSPKADRAKAKELVARGNDDLRAGRYAEARKSFQAALDADARSHAALAGLAAVAFENGDMARAILFGKRAVKLAPKVSRYHMTLAKAYYDLLRYKDAIAHWENVLEIDPGNAAAKRNIESARSRMR